MTKQTKINSIILPKKLCTNWAMRLEEKAQLQPQILVKKISGITMEDELDVYLIDGDGKRFSEEAISSHIGLAYAILSENEELRQEFLESSKTNLLDFLLTEKGYISVSKIGWYYRNVIYDSTLASEEQKRWIDYYKKHGYDISDVADEREKEQR